MDRNFLLAFALSFLVISLWMAMQPPPSESPSPEGPSTVAERPAAEPGEAATPEGAGPEGAIPDWQTPPPESPQAPFEAGGDFATPGPAAGRGSGEAQRTVTVETDLFRAELSSRGGTLAGFELKRFHDALDPRHPPVSLVTNDPILPGALATPLRELGLGDWSVAEFRVEEADRHRVVFSHTRAGVTLRKTYRFEEGSYLFGLELTLENGSDRVLQPIFETVWPAVGHEASDFRELSLAAYHDDGVQRLFITGRGMGAPGCGSPFGGDGTKEFVGGVSWAGADARYFLAALLPEVADVTSARFLPVEEGRVAVVTMAQSRIQLQPGARHAYEYRVYAGPKQRERLERPELAAADLDAAIQAGWSWIAPLTRFFSWLLASVHQYIPNYGLVIILITILVRLVTAPLLGRQMRSMKKMSTQMQELKPRLDAIKEKYGEDRQKMSEETMKAYREAGVNPFGMLGGCLPLLLQFPVFIGLFYALQSSIELRQAPFVAWIDDLSAPEALFVIPGLDLPFRVLPLIMGASMFLQQKLTPQTSMDPAQQRMMMTLMPIMFTVLFYQFPSGLVLYWMVSNFLAIGHQLWINRNPA